MSDPLKTLQGLVDKQKKAIDAQREASKQIENERQQAVTTQTEQSAPQQSPPPNK